MAARTYVEYQREHPTISYSEYCMVEEIWKLATTAAIDAMEAGQPDVQQLKPKMPSLSEVEQAFAMQVYGNHVSNDESHAVKFVYEYIARHFGR